MNKKNYHIYNQTFLNPLIRGIESSGASLDQILSRSSFKKFSFKNPEAYIPMKVLYDFLLIVRNEKYLDDITENFYRGVQINEFGDLGEFLAEQPDLYTMISEGIKYEHLLQTNTKIKLEISGKIAKFYTVHLDPPSVGRYIAEKMAFAISLNVCRMVLGKNWRPIEFQIPGFSAQWIEALIPIDNTTVTYGCEHYGWVFETKLLASLNKSKKETHTPYLKENSNTISENIFKMMEGLNDGYMPTQTDFSEYLNVSKRTMVRNLKTEGTKFSSILNKYLFIKSLKLLDDDNISILEISQKLGYANSPNFVRAFKNWTNSSPTQYRLHKVPPPPLIGV